MAKGAFQMTAVDTAGNVLEWPFTVTVRREVPGSPLARLYDADDNPLGNPLTITGSEGWAKGFFRFHTTGGFYRIDVAKGSTQAEPLRHVGIGTYGGADQGVINDPGYFFEFEEEITEPPGLGFFRANNADLSLATELYVSKTTRGGYDVGARLLELDPGGNAAKDAIHLRGIELTGATWLVDSVDDDTDYVTLHVSGHDGSTEFVTDVYALQREIAGADGVHPGFHFTFDGTSTADGDPGAGKFRLNSADHSLATEAYIDNVEALAGADMTAWLDSLDDSNSTVRGELLIADNADSAVFRSYNVTGSVVDGTGYRKVTIEYGVGAGSLTDGDLCVMEFIAHGDDGISPGYRLTMDAASTTDGDPGAGKVRFNHGTFASITEVYVDNLDQGSNDITGWLDGLDDVVNANARAYLRFQAIGDPTIYAEFAVTGTVTDGTGYRKIPVSPIAGAVPADATVLVAVDRKSGQDGAGTGDVTGDTASTAGNIAVFSDTSGKAIEDSGQSISDLVPDLSAVDQDIIPDTDSTRDLGSSTHAWAEVHADLVVTPGIQFPATQAPSADANTLDDYEEGTFTPTIGFGVSNGAVGVTYSNQDGKYLKVGKGVLVWVTITLTAKGSSTGVARVPNLPFTAGANAIGNVAYSAGFSSIGGGGHSVVGSSSTILHLRYQSSTGYTDLTNTNFSDTSSFAAHAAYTV